MSLTVPRDSFLAPDGASNNNNDHHTIIIIINSIKKQKD